MLSHFPEQQVSSAVLCNRGDADAPGLNIAVLSTTLAFTLPTQQMQPEMPARFVLAPERHAEYLGTFRSDEVGGQLRVFERNGSLFMERRPDHVDRLTAIRADAFSAPGSMTLRFERDASGVVTGLVVSVPRVRAMPYTRR